MARILMLTPQLPYPPQQGTSLRNLHMLKALAHSHEVTLLSFAEWDQQPELEPLQALAHVRPPVPSPVRTRSDRIQQLLRTKKPDLTLRLWSKAFQTALVDVLNGGSFDAVQIEGLELVEYMRVARATFPSVRVVLDCHNAETELQRRALRTDLAQPGRWPAALYSLIQVGRLAAYERWALSEADAAIAVSDVDRRHLQTLAPNRTITVIPNTIDVGEYNLPEPSLDGLRYDLVFTGKMDYRPNVDGVLWFAETVWPRIIAQRPQTTWAIVGQKPDHRLDGLRHVPGITVTGRVPSIQPYLSGAELYVAPLRVGSGSRLKLIEAMAAGKAILSTTIGAEGIGATDGEHLVLADTPDEWASAVLRLLDDPAERERLGTAARHFAARFDWRQTVPLLAQVYPPTKSE